MLTDSLVVLVMDNILLAISHHTSRRSHRRDRSWGGSTVNEDDTAGLISKTQSDTPALSQVQTVYAPYGTTSQQADFASSKISLAAPPRRPNDLRMSEGDIALHTSSSERPAGSFSYQNTPVEGLGVQIVASPKEYESHQEHNRKGKEKVHSGDYESLASIDERVYDGEHYDHIHGRTVAFKGV